MVSCALAVQGAHRTAGQSEGKRVMEVVSLQLLLCGQSWCAKYGPARALCFTTVHIYHQELLTAESCYSWVGTKHFWLQIIMFSML